MTTKDLSKIFFIPRGDYFPIYVTVEDADGNPIDLTGKTVKMSVKKRLNDPDEVTTITKEIVSHTDPTHGQTLIELTPTDTDVEDSGIFQVEFQVITGTNPTTFERCGMQFQQDVLQESGT